MNNNDSATPPAKPVEHKPTGPGLLHKDLRTTGLNFIAANTAVCYDFVHMDRKRISRHPLVIAIRDILTEHVMTIEPGSSAEDAIALMRRRRISCVIVAEKRKPVGIFTERNLVACADSGIDFSSTSIDSIMSSPVITAQSSITVYEAFDIFATQKIRHLVIVNTKGHTAGVLTLSDLISHLGIEYFVEIKTVSKVMNRSVVSIPLGSPLSLALSHMARKKISCVFIEDNHLPVGIITERDMTRVIHEKNAIASMSVDQVMSSPIRTIAIDLPLHEAIKVMNRHKCRRLGVTDRSGALTGLITQSDVIKGVEGRYTESLRDVVREKEEQLQEALRNFWEKSVYLDNIMRSSTDSAIIATDLDLHIKYFNPVAERLMGQSARDMIGQRLEAIHARQEISPGRLERALAAVKRNGEYHFSIERTENGHQLALECRVSGIWDHEQSLIGYVLTLRDVTERRRLEEQLKMAATIDKLTGIYNRQTLDDVLAREIARAHRYKTPLSLIMADIDHFKQVNDSFGHQIGDQVLRAIAVTLKESVRRSDMVGRWGGEEFMIVAPQTEIENTIAMAEKLRKLIAGRSFPHNDTVTVSMGVARMNADDTIESIIHRADEALYAAKHAGRNRVETR